jgi:hypothetical protein
MKTWNISFFTGLIFWRQIVQGPRNSSLVPIEFKTSGVNATKKYYKKAFLPVYNSCKTVFPIVLIKKGK